MAWEIKGTTGSLDGLNIEYQSKVSAPKNPKLIREIKKLKKVNLKQAQLTLFQILFKIFFFKQLTPSEFLKEMSMDTRQKLASTHEMYLPKIVELLDMGETSLQKVI